MAFASGKYALAICDRCGFRVKYSAMREEWNGSRVCPECFETKHPQLDPPRVRADAEALRDARPDRVEPTEVAVGETLPVFPFNRYNLLVRGQLGSLSLISNNTLAVTGVSATGDVGSVTVSIV